MQNEEQIYNIQNYEKFLGDFKTEGAGHWEKIQKRTATLFQVLMDEDLKELVFILEHYPNYIEIVCEHFRYLYNYSNKTADIFAASKLLYMSEQYHQKQFVRNLLRKLQRIDEYEITKIKDFLEKMLENQERIHPIILGYYKGQIETNLSNGSYHKLQILMIKKSLDKLLIEDSFDYDATDRDANLDIPYMN